MRAGPPSEVGTAMDTTVYSQPDAGSVAHALGSRHNRQRSPLTLADARRAEQKLIRRIKACLETGRNGQARDLQRTYLRSFAAKLVAVHDANDKLKKWHRVTKDVLRQIAEEMHAWSGSVEPVHIRSIPKRNGDYRMVCSFGLRAKALQLLIGRAVTPFSKFATCQFMFVGGRAAACAAVRELLRSGYRHVVELDIKDCYGSFDNRRLHGFLPLPRRVTEANIASDRRSLTHSNDDPGDLRNREIRSRRGIAQGSSLSPLVAETLIAAILKTLSEGDIPLDVVLVVYADNILVLGRSEASVEVAATSLGRSFRNSRVGSLVLHRTRCRRVCDGFDFLGYRFRVRAGRIAIRPSDKNLVKFAERCCDLRYGDKKGSFADLDRYSRSWTNSFPLWNARHLWARGVWTTVAGRGPSRQGLQRVAKDWASWLECPGGLFTSVM